MLCFNKNNRDSLSVASVRYPVVQIISKLHMIKQIRMSKRKKSKERMPLDECQGHTTRLRPGRRPTFAVVEGRNPLYPLWHNQRSASLHLGRDTHKAWHVGFFFPPSILFNNLLPVVNRLLRLPDDLWGHDDDTPRGDSADRGRLFKALRPSTLTRD